MSSFPTAKVQKGPAAKGGHKGRPYSSAGASDQRFMARALEIGELGLGETNPNPAVGCVLVKGGKIVGEGFHARAGSHHAEAAALAVAGAKARGATAYVTLEPCVPNPLKRTPPCAPRLIEAGVKRVVFAASDANPNVRGEGARLLRASGITVVQMPGAEAALLSQHFNVAMSRGRPFITLKAGATLDGCIATARGESKWITSEDQRAAARRLRRLFDGVLVGYETAREDDPALLPDPLTSRPFPRVVLDSHLRLPRKSRLIRTAREHPVILVGTEAGEVRRRGLEAQGVSVILVEARGGRVFLPAALEALHARGLHSLIVEGGAEVMGSFVRGGLFDELVLFRAPLLLGGRGSRGMVGGPNPRSLAEGVRMKRAARSTSATLRYGLESAAGLEVEVYQRDPESEAPESGRTGGI